MTEEAIVDTIAAFAQAIDAKNLGFDTVEIHGGHGHRPSFLEDHQPA